MNVARVNYYIKKEKSLWKSKNGMKCGSCHRTAVVGDKEIPPRCCGKPMNKLPHEICLQPSHAESARSIEKMILVTMVAQESNPLLIVF